jgi:hypothetical protein
MGNCVFKIPIHRAASFINYNLIIEILYSGKKISAVCVRWGYQFDLDSTVFGCSYLGNAVRMYSCIDFIVHVNREFTAIDLRITR